MKIGDKIVCINNVNCLDKGRIIDFTVNKIYTVTKIKLPFLVYIHDDFNWEVYCEYPNQFNDYFIILKELRKQKLEKIYEQHK